MHEALSIYLVVSVYLGLHTWNNQTGEKIKRRIQLGWVKFGTLSYIFWDHIHLIYMKRQVFDQCIIPVLSYGAETRTTTKWLEKKIKGDRESNGKEVGCFGLTSPCRSPGAHSGEPLTRANRTFTRSDVMYLGLAPSDPFHKQGTWGLLGWAPGMTSKLLEHTGVDPRKLIEHTLW